MNQKHYLITGTFLLTFTGFLTRIAGFFYKIFLSRTIGAAQIGLFQLTMPVYAFCMAVACGGIQTAVSRFTAEYHAENNTRRLRLLLKSSLLLSGGLSLVCSAFLFTHAQLIAERFLLEKNCTQLLQILAISLPFCVIHSCLCGYFTGLKNIMPSALTQLLEQIFRIGCTCLCYVVFLNHGCSMTASVMAVGQLFGELASSLFCMIYLTVSPEIVYLPKDSQEKQADTLPYVLKQTLSVSAPLGLNRMLLCILQAIEASLLPQKLQIFGHSSTDSLMIYGTLTGMAMPLLLFPTAITGALGTLLLPSVSEARTLNHQKQISDTANICFYTSILPGFLFSFFLLLFGKSVGILMFDSAVAGLMIQKLGLICPFLYLNTTMTSIVHGLGKSTSVFWWSISGFLIRLLFVLFAVDVYGIDAYVYGMICSQIFTSICLIYTLVRSHSLTFTIPLYFRFHFFLNRKNR